MAQLYIEEVSLTYADGWYDMGGRKWIGPFVTVTVPPYSLMALWVRGVPLGGNYVHFGFPVFPGHTVQLPLSEPQVLSFWAGASDDGDQTVPAEGHVAGLIESDSLPPAPPE